MSVIRERPQTEFVFLRVNLAAKGEGFWGRVFFVSIVESAEETQKQ